jgi:hypothetical protein
MAKRGGKGGLGKWFGEEWVDISRTKKDGTHPPCGRDEADTSSRGYPKCRPKAEAARMSPNKKRLAVRRKRRQPQGVGGKPTIVR